MINSNDYPLMGLTAVYGIFEESNRLQRLRERLIERMHEEKDQCERSVLCNLIIKIEEKTTIASDNDLFH